MTAETVAGLSADGVVVATGAAPYAPALPLGGLGVVQAWDALADPARAPGTVVVADWGGDPAGIAVAETLRAAGQRVTLCVSSVTVGESLHQYRRNLALQRLYRAEVEIVQHVELARSDAEGVVFRNVFAPERETVFAADTLVLALGRVPVDTLAPELRAAGHTVEEAGDCLSPRSLEEATLEGTMAARLVSARLSAPS